MAGPDDYEDKTQAVPVEPAPSPEPTTEPPTAVEADRTASTAAAAKAGMYDERGTYRGSRAAAPGSDLGSTYRDHVAGRDGALALDSVMSEVRAQEQATKPKPQTPKLQRTPEGYPYYQAEPGAQVEDVPGVGAIPVYTGDPEADTLTAERSNASKVLNRLLGIDPSLPPEEALRRAQAGEPFADRYQLWPERMVRSAATLAGDVVSGKEVVTPGLRREDFTDEPAPGVGAAREGGIPGVQGLLRPVAQQPGDRVVERAQDLTGAMVTGAIPGMPRGALGAAGGRPLAEQAGVRTADEAINAIAAKRGMTPEQVRENWGYANPNDYLTLAQSEGIPVAPAAEPFFSAVQRAVTEAPLETAPPKDWLGYLANRPGVKKEEMEWIGLEPWLKEQPGPVSKAEVVQFVRENQVQVQTITKANTPPEAAWDALTPEQQASVMQEFKDFVADGDEAAFTREYPTSLEAREAAQNWYSQQPEASDAMLAALRRSHAGGTKYGDYQLPGGTNYREVLLTLPEKAPPPPKPVDITGFKVETVSENSFTGQREIRILDAEGDMVLSRSGFSGTDAEAVADYVLTRNQADQIGVKQDATFKSGHWDETNVLAHARLNDRVIDGKKTLFVEEVQSDWHQKGRRSGYGPFKETKPDDLVDGKRVGVEVTPAGVEAGTPKWEFKNQVTGEQEFGWGATLEEARDNALSWANSELRRGAQAGMVPNAPFKTSWPELALKRLIKMAADEGYEQIAWTDGKTQAARYDLSKQIERVEFRKSGTSGFTRREVIEGNADGRLMAYDHSGRKVIDQYVADQTTIADYIGKDAAEKLLAAEGRDAQHAGNAIVMREISGVDLQVGGEGMVGFYDKILVKTANKLGKKFGAKVEDSTIPGRYTVVERDVRGTGGQRGGKTYRVQDGARTGDNVYVGGQFDTREAAQAWIEIQGDQGGARIHTLPIPPKMAEVAKVEGFPLFQAGVPLPRPESQEEFMRRMEAQQGGSVFETGAPPVTLIPRAAKDLTPSYMARALETTGAVLKDIAKGTFRESPRAVVRGVIKAADNTAGALNSLGDWLNQNVADLSFAVPSSGNATVDAVGGALLNPVDAIKNGLHAMVGYIPQPGSVTGKMIESTAQFLAGYIPALGVARAAGLGGAAAPVVAGSGSSFLTSTPEEGGVANFLQQWPAMQGPVTKFLATDPNDPEALNRLRHGIEAAGFGLLTEGVLRAIRFAANSRRSAQSVQALRDVDEAAGAAINQHLNTMGGAADQPLVLVKGKSVGPTVPAGDNVPGRAAAALGRSAQETTLGVPDHVAAAGVVKDAKTGLIQLVDVGPEGTNQAVKAGRKGVYINLGRVETADDVKTMIQQVADAMAPEVTAAKRGVMPLEETSRLASRLGMTAEELVARPKGQALNAEQIVAANRILTTSAENLWALAEKAAAPTSSVIDGFNFRRALTVHNAIQQAVLGANAEAGRALSALRIARQSSGAAMNRELTAMMDQLGGMPVAQDMARRMLDLRASGVAEGAIEAASRRGWLATTQAMVRESYALGQLWNPKTHIRNLSSNLLVAFQQAYERGAAAQIGRLLGTPADEAVIPGEAIAYLYGQVSSLKDAFRLAGRAIVDDQTIGVLGKVDVPLSAISSSSVSRELGHSAAEAAAFAKEPMGRAIDFIGTATRMPGRMLGAEDQFFKTIAFSAEIRAQALRKAAQEGLSGRALADRVADLVANPPEWLRQTAVDHALYATFNNEPGRIAQALLQARNYDGHVNPLFLAVPYIRTPSNILRYMANRTPLAALSRHWWDDIASGGARRDLALARMATGTAVMAAALDYASSGIVTGAGPSSAAEKEALRGTGWQPYSIKIGGKYYSYQGIEPFSTILAFAAGIAETVKASDLAPEDFDAFEELIGQAMGIVATNVVDKSYFQGLASAVKAIEDAGRGQEGAFAAFFTRQVAGLVPLASVGRMVNDLSDPTRREPANMWEGIMSQIPLMRDRLIPARSVWGEPVKPQEVYGAAYDAMSPFYVSRETNSAVDNELVKHNSGVQRIPWKTSFAGAQVNFRDFPQVLDEYRRLAGNELKHPAWGLGAKDYLDQVVSGRHSMSQVYQILSDGPEGGKVAFIKNTVSEYRKLAQDQILADAEEKYPTFYQYVTGKQAKKLELKMPVEPAAAPQP